MSDKEIIKGLLLYLEDTEINVSKLVQEIGMKNYKKFYEALQIAIDEYGKD